MQQGEVPAWRNRKRGEDRAQRGGRSAGRPQSVHEPIVVFFERGSSHRPAAGALADDPQQTTRCSGRPAGDRLRPGDAVPTRTATRRCRPRAELRYHLEQPSSVDGKELLELLQRDPAGHGPVAIAD